MLPDDTRRRKACQSCTRAKAKCSPFENRHDLCYRCQRLEKECVYDDIIRKRGPKARSRVRQLEQRVDTLIDLLAANGRGANATQPREIAESPAGSAQDGTSNGLNSFTEPRQPSVFFVTPANPPCVRPSNTETFAAHDPVDAGVIEQRDAALLLRDYQSFFVNSFPFVVIPAATDANALRRQQPFLFLAIMAVTATKSPQVQEALAEEMKNQIAARIIGRSQKSLEILQGLLVFAAFYHYFYQPERQQLSIIIHLCVAIIQDLGISKNPRDKARKFMSGVENEALLKSERPIAEKRAFLGTFYLTAQFAHVWRKRCTMRYSRYMDQCCQFFADHPEGASDALIAPLIRSSELMTRISDYFSYDDIDSADVQGDLMLEVSTTNFRSELDRIRSSTPTDFREKNAALQLKFCLVDTWIHECALHSSLWSPASRPASSPLSPVRIKLLYRCMDAMKSYFHTLVATPQSALHHLAFPAWSGWLYATIVACKLVFLEDNERDADTDVEPSLCEIEKLVSDKFTNGAPDCQPPPPVVDAATAWDPIKVAAEAEVHQLFDRLFKLMQFTVPMDPKACTADHCDPLLRITFLQQSLFHGFTKRLKAHVEASARVDPNAAKSAQASQQDAVTGATPPQYQQNEVSGVTLTPQAQYAHQSIQRSPVPLIEQLHFNLLNFDSVLLPDTGPMLQPPGYDDWLWDMAMDDFTIPRM